MYTDYQHWAPKLRDEKLWGTVNSAFYLLCVIK